MYRLISTLACIVSFAVTASAGESPGEDVTVLPEGAQAYSLFGEALVSSPPDQETLDKLEAARVEYERDPTDADNIIWYGRRMAYTGNYLEAISIFSEGIARHPDDARMYRHRGHRYISVREFDRAIEDLEHAATLIEGTEDRIEPDGLPNALNIPVSTLRGNIWYHLGLAYYLKHDWPNAYRAYQAGFQTGSNDDNYVSTTHWRYMILRRMGKVDQARRALDGISRDMNVIENTVYHRLCLFYKGALTLEEMTAEVADGPTGAAGAYGIANWFYYNGNKPEAQKRMQQLVNGEGWDSFGYIAAEADLASLDTADSPSTVASQ
ncbi:MAG TPA: tetratricopeptide repeat protein [Woeseiaceae bacterium]|nr:tetratricopeptide repeat protein [Woeseiaceae bacterium]